MTVEVFLIGALAVAVDLNAGIYEQTSPSVVMVMGGSLQSG
jgi:hypothetical protein